MNNHRLKYLAALGDSQAIQKLKTLNKRNGNYINPKNFYIALIENSVSRRMYGYDFPRGGRGSGTRSASFGYGELNGDGFHQSDYSPYFAHPGHGYNGMTLTTACGNGLGYGGRLKALNLYYKKGARIILNRSF